MLTFRCFSSLHRMALTAQELECVHRPRTLRAAGVDNSVKETLEEIESNFLIGLIKIILLKYCLFFLFIFSWKFWGQSYVILLCMTLYFWKEDNFDQMRTTCTKRVAATLVLCPGTLTSLCCCFGAHFCPSHKRIHKGLHHNPFLKYSPLSTRTTFSTEHLRIDFILDVGIKELKSSSLASSRTTLSSTICTPEQSLGKGEMGIETSYWFGFIPMLLCFLHLLRSLLWKCFHSKHLHRNPHIRVCDWESELKSNRDNNNKENDS